MAKLYVQFLPLSETAVLAKFRFIWKQLPLLYESLKTKSKEPKGPVG